MPRKPLSAVKEMVGESRVTVRGLRVEAGKVEEFARGIHETDPVYRNETVAAQRGHDRIPAPLTFTHTSFFPQYQPEGINSIEFDLKFDMERTIHSAHRFAFDYPVHVGDTLTGTSTLVDVYQREGERGGTMTFAEIATDYAGERGRSRLYVDHDRHRN